MSKKTKSAAANWEVIFDELEKAIRQLQTHDAHSSLEAALLLKAALAVLRARGPQAAYDAILGMLLDLVQLSERRAPLLTESTSAIISELEDPLIQRLCETADHMLADRLTSEFATGP